MQWSSFAVSEEGKGGPEESASAPSVDLLLYSSRALILERLQ